jgi:hypothetical protein
MGDQNVPAKSRQLLHMIDAKIAAANEQQGLSLLAKLTELSKTAYEAPETLKMPFVVSKRGRPSSTKRLPLAVERASQEYKKEKKRKLSLARQNDVASCNLPSTNVNSAATAIVDFTMHTRLHLESMVNGNISSDIPSYLPHESTMDIFDPRADGNCGFRALAKAVYGSEEEWRRVKDDLLDAYRKDEAFYQDVHGFDHSRILEILNDRTEVTY